MEKNILIRKAKTEDYPDLADLASQLGYPCKAEDVKNRIFIYLNNDTKAIIVAEDAGKVVGWASVEVIDHFYLDSYADISGFVVDKEHRGNGIGKLMMDEIESWVKERGLGLLRLKTNITRKDAHRFYERLSFEKTKEQFVYSKSIK